MPALIGGDPYGWIFYVVTTVVPYLVRETVLMVAAAVAEHPAGLVLALLAFLGLWKLMEALFWVLRRAWIPLLVAAGVGLVVSGLVRI